MRRFRSTLEVGVLIRDARQSRQLTQAQLAANARVGRQWLVAVEAGTHERAEIGKVLSVLSALDIELFARTSDESAEPSTAASFLEDVLNSMRDDDGRQR